MQEPYYQQVPSTNALAIVSLIAGITGLTIFFGFGSVVALITGYIAKRQILERSEGGEGMAKAGIIMGWIGVVLVVLGVCLWVALMAMGMGAAFCPLLFYQQ